MKLSVTKISLLRFLSICLIAGLFSCKKTQQSDENSAGSSDSSMVSITHDQFGNASLKHGSMKAYDFSEKVSTNGVIDAPPSSKAVVTAMAGGFIKDIRLIIGDSVKAGQTVVTVENPEFISMQREYLEAYEKNTFLKSEYERQKRLFDEKVSSEKKFLKAESDYKTNLAVLNSREKQLQLLRISTNNVRQGNFTSQVAIPAPTHGHIVNVSVQPGMYVSPTDEILEIVNNDHLHVELKVYEKDVLKIREGQTIRFSLPEISDEVYDGEVKLVGTLVDEVNRTVLVHGHFSEEEHHNFAVGMFVSAEIMTDSKQEMALPESAFFEVEEAWYVLKLVSDKDQTYTYEKVKIDRGASIDGMVAILNAEAIDIKSTFMTEGVFALMLD